jgi:hypothetical protein
MNFLAAPEVVVVVEAVVVLHNILKSNDPDDHCFSIFFSYAIMINNGI